MPALLGKVILDWCSRLIEFNRNRKLTKVLYHEGYTKASMRQAGNAEAIEGWCCGSMTWRYLPILLRSGVVPVMEFDGNIASVIWIQTITFITINLTTLRQPKSCKQCSGITIFTRHLARANIAIFASFVILLFVLLFLFLRQMYLVSFININSKSFAKEGNTTGTFKWCFSKDAFLVLS